jgi:ATP-dependent Lon protease
VEIPDNIKGKLDIRPVKWIDEVLELALTRQPTPRPDAVAATAPVPVKAAPAKKRGRRTGKLVQAH